MIGRICAALFLVPILTLSAFANSAQRGWEAYERGDYQVAMEEWWLLASSGNAAAEFNLGLMYEVGKGVPQNYTVAAEWYRKAALHGSASAQNNLAYLYGRGRGVPRDYSQAISWYRKAADQGYGLAQLSLGSFYLKGLGGLPRSYATAAQWYRKAAHQGIALAQYNLGAMYLTGQGVQKNREEAVKWYRKAALQGHLDARRTLHELGETTDAKSRPLYALKAERDGPSSNSSRSGFEVQLAAIKTDAPKVAVEKAGQLTEKLAPTLGNLKVLTIRADLGERGVYYRLRVGPLNDRVSAETLCENLKSQQQACVVVAPQKS